MGRWWYEDVVEPGKLPLLLLTFAFVVTFVITRIIVRAIRAGKGPFKDNSVGGIHVHHVVPGLVLMVLGGVVLAGAQTEGWRVIAAVVFGIGLALVLDEFALILHLEDVYWEQEGRMSVDVVFVLLSILVLSLLVGSPVGIDDQTGEEVGTRIGVMVSLALSVGFAVLAAMKGKYVCAVIGIFIWLVAFVAAIRVARPNSWWARKRYRDDPAKRQLSEEREARFSARYRSRITRVQDAVAGTGPAPGGD
jgi:hypothetical protein